MSTDGISALRNRKASRNSRQAPPPRHPMPTGVVAEFGSRGGDESPVSEPAAIAVSAPAAPPPAAPRADVLAGPQGDATKRTEAGGTGTGGAGTGRGQLKAESDRADTERDESSGGVSRGNVPRELPDLEIDWTDPLMHVASPTRVSVANSVATRFKAVADQPGSAPQTQLIMEAVSDHLAELPELVLKRRPEESGPAPSGFFVRRAPVQKPEPWQPVYMRPIAGEVEALRRIIEWVNDIITAGHPGRQKSTRSEVVTAALDASYPATA